MNGKARRSTERPRGQAKQGQAKRGQAKPSHAKPSKSKTMQDIARVPKFTTKCTLRFRLAAFFLIFLFLGTFNNGLLNVPRNRNIKKSCGKT